MPGSENRIDLAAEQAEKALDVKSMSHRRVGQEIFFCEPKQPSRRVHPPPILRVGRPRVLFLQMHKSARGLDQPFEVIRVLRFGPQPEMLQDIVRFVVALLIPAAEKAHVARMLRDVARPGEVRRAAQFFHQLGNSLAFVHGKLNLVSAEMTGNRAPIVFQRRAGVRAASGEG